MCIHYTGNIRFVYFSRDQQWQFFFAENFCETSYINYIPIMASQNTSNNYSTARWYLHGRPVHIAMNVLDEFFFVIQRKCVYRVISRGYSCRHGNRQTKQETVVCSYKKYSIWWRRLVILKPANSTAIEAKVVNANWTCNFVTTATTFSTSFFFMIYIWITTKEVNCNRPQWSAEQVFKTSLSGSS